MPKRFMAIIGFSSLTDVGVSINETEAMSEDE